MAYPKTKRHKISLVGDILLAFISTNESPVSGEIWTNESAALCLLSPQMVVPLLCPWEEAVKIASRQLVLLASAAVVTGPAISNSSKSSLI